MSWQKADFKNSNPTERIHPVSPCVFYSYLDQLSHERLLGRSPDSRTGATTPFYPTQFVIG